MSDIKIICDSLCDLMDEQLKKYDIDMVPLTVIINGKEYLDRVNLFPDEFYKMLREEDVFPKTSQATFAQFEEVFKKYTDEGKTILYIGASHNATGCIQSAMMAKNEIDGDIHIFDSLSVCFGIGIQVLEAARLRDEGKSIEEILEALHECRDRAFVVFFGDTLEYLKKGGRISTYKATPGTALNIKPILYVNDEGIVSQLGQARGRKKVVSKMIEYTGQYCGKDLSDRTVYIGYTDSIEERDQLIEGVKSVLNCKNVEVFRIGTGIGTHGGPGVTGLITFK